MKKEEGMGIIAIILVIILIALLGFLTYYFIKNTAKDKKVEDIKANMLLIQGKCKVISETSKVNKNENSFKGRKISDIKEDSIISEFLSKGILPEDKLDKYYALSNDDLKSMELDITNEENTYYIVNYEENTVFITAGYTNENEEEIVYKLD